MLTAELLGSVALLLIAIYIVIRQVYAVRAERVLRETNQFASEIIDNAGEGIVVYDLELRYLLWNRFMEELTGLPAERVIGEKATELFPHLLEQRVDDLLYRAMQGETVASPDIHYYVPGTEKKGWISAVYRPHQDSHGKIVGAIGLIRDITERKTAEQQIEYQAYHDALTGLANRRLFQEHLTLALALAVRRQRLVGVLFLDLDQFKIVNDSLGHSVGDELLKQLASRLKSAVREGDTVARVGGDEFTIVLQDLPQKDDAVLVANKILRAVSQPFEVAGNRLYLTTSIGITIYPDDGEDAETLLKNADNAMYRAKAEGRNTYHVSTRELNRSMQDRITLESGLHLAMERDEFEILYQPQIDLQTMTVSGMEALLRWKHPTRGVISPSEFISVAEERGYIVVIGDWVLRKSCEQVMSLRQSGFFNLRVAVNISPRQFREPTLVSRVQSALQESGLEPSFLELEITENVAMENVDLTIEVLTQLRAIGIKIAIDDFGTGHSSLRYLKQFPIDTLKIDRGFVEDLPAGLEDAAIVKSVIQLAQGLNLRVIAEGVERKDQLEFLRENGCREVQGYYFGLPLRASELDKIYSSGLTW